METFDIDYSMKNIPLPSKEEYIIQLISKTEHLIKRMRWKVLEFMGKLEGPTKNTYGFKSRKCPPTIKELAKFESDMMYMIKNVEFRKIDSEFLNKIKNDIEEKKSDKRLFVSADKSRNIYKIAKEDYNKLIKENITKTYKKSHQNKLNNINKDTKKLVTKLEIADRIEKMQENNAYITIKDHKETFPNKIPCRLINPAKSDIGKISKSILDRINRILLTKTNDNQWKNTDSVIKWFQEISEKKSCSFIVFDIESFYPSISETLFNNAINFAKMYTL